MLPVRTHLASLRQFVPSRVLRTGPLRGRRWRPKPRGKFKSTEAAVGAVRPRLGSPSPSAPSSMEFATALSFVFRNVRTLSGQSARRLPFHSRVIDCRRHSFNVGMYYSTLFYGITSGPLSTGNTEFELEMVTC